MNNEFHNSPFGLYSQEADDMVEAALEQGMRLGLRWPSIYWYILDNVYDVDELTDTSAREAIMYEFERRGGVVENSNYNSNYNSNTEQFPTYLPANALPTRVLPKNTTNTIMGNAIQNGNVMANFHSESRHGRHYKKSTLNAMPTPKKNPFTRRNIKPMNVIYYKAKLEGGKRRRVMRKTRKSRK